MPFTADEVADVVAVTSAGPFPMVESQSMALFLAETVKPAVESLPPHHDCEVVRLALESLFVMGLAAGIELGARL